MEIQYFDSSMSTTKQCFIDCQHHEAPNCLGRMQRKVESVKKNIKKNSKYICDPCIKWIKKQKKLELKGTFLKVTSDTVNYIERKLSGQTQICKNELHESRCRCIFPIYPFPKDKVPVEDFVNPNSTTPFEYCLGCRTYRTQGRQYRKEVAISKDVEGSRYKTCLYESHTRISTIPKDKVPIEKFLTNPKNPESKVYEYCLDCRDECSNVKKNLLIKRIKEKEEMGQDFCISCLSPKEDEEIGTNKDGSKSSQCIHCKEKSNERGNLYYKERREHYRNLQYEAILTNECSCKICKCIFLKPEENFTCIRLQVVEENGENIVYYKNERYIVKKFIQQFKNLLELRILDFDHLPSDDPDMQKIDTVGNFQTKEGMTMESKKCQLIDCLCHVVVTVEREKGEKNPSGKCKEKFDYVNNIKRKGCTMCSFIPEENMLRFMHMDHIDPKTKRECISRIACLGIYSMEDLVHECTKCRCLCAFCHRIRTSIQFENGEFIEEVDDINYEDEFW